MISAVALTLGLLTTLGASSEASVVRATVAAGEVTSVTLTPFDDFIVVDPSVIEVQRNKNVLELRGTRSGQTQLQVYRGQALSLVMVAVTSPVSHAAGAASSLLQGYGSRGPLTSAFGANSFTTQVDANSQYGVWNTDSLEANGLVNDGTYHADVRATFGALGNRLLRAQLAWLSKDGTQLLVLGDTPLTVPVSRMLNAFPGLGVTYSVGDASFRKQFFVGNLSSAASTVAAQPIFVSGVEGRVRLQSVPDAQLSHAASLLAFADAATKLGPGRTGALVGERLRLEHAKGFALEARGSLMLSSENQLLRRSDLGGEIGVAASYRDAARRTANLSYDANVGAMYNPAIHVVAPETHRVLLTVGERFSSKVYASTSLGYSLVKFADVTTHSYSGTVFGQFTVSPKTLAIAQVTVQGTVAAPPVAKEQRSQRIAGLEVRHVFSDERSGKVSLQYQGSTNDVGTRDAVVAALQGGHRSKRDWFVDGNASVLFEKLTTTLAVDQPPLTVQVSAGANGGWVTQTVGVVAGLNVQKVVAGAMASSSAVGLSANVGVQFAPTIAHRVTANVSTTQYLGANRGVVAGSLAYTFQFGDAIHAPPLFQLFSGSQLEGAVCVDANGDAVCGPSEEPLPGVAVALSNGQSTVTDAQGRYRFSGLAKGSYKVEPDRTSLKKLGRMTTPSSKPFEVAEAEKVFESFGVRRGCQIRGRVTHDLDVSGAYSEGDVSFDGAVVRASGSGVAAEIAEAHSEADGTFRIDVSTCGTFTVDLLAESLPESTRVVTEPLTVLTSLDTAPPEVGLSMSALRTLSGVVFVDSNRNGRQDKDERPVASAKVQWVREGRAGGAVLSGAKGEVLFRRLPAGRLTVTVTVEASNGLEPRVFELTLPNGATFERDVPLGLVPATRG